MNKRFIFAVFLCALCVIGASPGFANIWIDEGFEDDIAFGPSDTGTGAIADGIDVYHDPTWSGYNPSYPMSAVLTHNGVITGERAFLGTKSYCLEAGQSIALAEPYSATTTGSVHYLQFAVNVKDIPAAGTMASFEWNVVIEDVANTFFVDFDSDGTKVDIVAGENQRGLGSQVIGTLNGGSTEWKFITIQVNVNFGEADSRVGQVSIAQGVHYYVGSSTPAYELAGAPHFPSTKDVDRSSRDWSFVVNSGTLYLDEVYWECGFDDGNGPFLTDATQTRLRPLNFGGFPFVSTPVSDVQNWQNYK